LNGDDNEKPRGEWNTLDLLCLGQTGIHVVNGTVNLVLTNISRNRNGRIEPLTRGRLTLQSEGAEVFFRNIRLKPIREIPEPFPEALARAVVLNPLTEAERREGWGLLFDGETTTGWRGFRAKTVPAGWQPHAGALTVIGKAGDLVTERQYDNF